MTAWITLLVASLLTLALRAGPSLLGDRVAVPAALQRANRFAAPALMGRSPAAASPPRRQQPAAFRSWPRSRSRWESPSALVR